MANLKQIKNLIEKYAQDYPVRKHPRVDSPAGIPAGVPQKGKNTVNPTAPTPTVAAADPGIMAMQEALVNLSRSFTSQRTDLKPAIDHPTRKSFADFVSGNLKDPKSGGSPVLDSLKQLSDPKTGGFPLDGKWGPKTYAALHRAADFGQSIFKIANQFKLNPTSYSEENLNILMTFINGDKLTQAQKVSNASEITKHINAISALYSEVMKSIMSSPAMKEKIEGMPAEKNSLPPQVIDALNGKYNSFSVSFQSDAGVVQKPITVNDFTSKEALQAWKDKNMNGVPIQLSNIVSQLKQQVERMQ